MTAMLPRTGSVWMQDLTGKPCRVVLVNHMDVVAHDCELTAADPDPDAPMNSWAGSPDEFFKAHSPMDPSLYPKTATL